MRCGRRFAEDPASRVAEIEVPNPREIHERGETSFGRRAALTTAVYAVVLSIAALGGNNTVKEMLLAQQQSSDQWAFYQAKVIREHQYRSQKMLLEAQLAEPSSLTGAERAKVEALAAKFAEEEKRYNVEKKEIETEAKKLEAARDHRRERHPYFEFGEVLLQIAIVTASVSILATSRQMFWFSLVLAVVGAAFAVNGFVPIFKLPLLHHH